jgi:UDP-2,4-diacetamido-2,4,6-trideoxy-beta-L-altropyranose hydrolase
MSSIRLRPVAEADAALLLAWRQHPDTRQWANNREPPAWLGCAAWGHRRLSDPEYLTYIAVQGRHPVGVIVLEDKGAEWELSIAVAPGLRGHGIGTAMLTALNHLHPERSIFATVLSDNDVSHRLFRSAGWRAEAAGRYLRACGPVAARATFP